jgi:2-methylisocitrate lyase-like PEP mutase family enzyme
VLTHAAKGEAFAALHAREGAFIIPNPWDAGTARLLAVMGFEALATTSAGCAFSAGQPDNTMTREETIAHAAAIASAQASGVRVRRVRRNGPSRDDPEHVAETVRMAGKAGLAGGSIEDASARTGGVPYEIELAADRIGPPPRPRAACPFALRSRHAPRTSSSVGPILPTRSAIAGLSEAGADVLYAPDS